MEHGRREAEQPPRRRSRPRRRGGSVAGAVFKTLGTLILIGICTSAMVAGIFVKYAETTLAPVLQVNADDYTMNLSSFIYYHDDAVEENDGWVEYQTVHGQENRVLVTYDQIPEALWQAAVAIEDQRFFQHNGVDWLRTIKATVNIFGDGATFGGSTITQQVLKNMTKDNAGTINRKVREIFRALEFEKNYTKEEILTLYLNTIYLGKGCYGVQTAAQYYFGKDVWDLDVAECASLIAITNNPSMYGPMYDIKITVEKDDGTTEIKTPRELNKRRQENILFKMYDPDTGLCYLTEEEYEAAKAETLQFTDGDETATAEELVTKATGSVGVNSWFTDEVLRDVKRDLAEELHISEDEALLKIYNSGYHIYTTLDPKIQEIAESVYEDRGNLNNLTSRDGQLVSSGITIIEPSTGNIVAQVGNMGEKEGNLLTNYATIKKQVGSSIKPLTCYSPAIDAGAVTPGTGFDNYPVQELNGNPWPKNSPSGYTGWTMVQDGLMRSINTIAVQTLQAVGVEQSYAFATEKLGLSLSTSDMNLAALGMGGLTYGLNTVEMAAAYAAFANNGIYNEPRTYLRVLDSKGNVVLENETESHVAMKETTAYLMNQMLKRVITGGAGATGGSANFSGMTIAGKTGTTSDNYDRYFVGYTPYYVAAVWTGYQYNAKISYSGNPSITLWKKVMQQVHADLPNKDFDKPSTGLELVQVCQDSGLLCTDACHADVRGDRAVNVTVAAGTAPTQECTLHAFRDYCTEGQVLATDKCPAESVVQKGFLDYVRVDYGSGITATDDPYLIVNMEKALEPTEDSPGGCPVHNGLEVEDPEPVQDPENDPSDPNYNPPPPTETGGEPGVTPAEPTEPAEPVEPPAVDPGAGDDDWWGTLWNTAGR